MRIAITGGAGLLGSALVQLVVMAGHTVVAIDRVRRRPIECHVDFRLADTTTYSDVAAAIKGCDAVVHLAAHTSPQGTAPYQVHNDNVTSSYNVMTAAVSAGIMRICQASSVNAIGGEYSAWPQYDYLPLDELHPSYNEDPYSLSKWVCEAQADSLARSHSDLAITSLRFHSLVAERATFAKDESSQDAEVNAAKELWGYTTIAGAARACLLAVTAAPKGHTVLYTVASRTRSEERSETLRRRFFPDVPLRHQLVSNQAFFDCTKALRVLSWEDS